MSQAGGAVDLFEEFGGMSREKLDALYKASETGPIPQGDSRGKAILFPGSAATRPLSKVAPIFWGGKVFNPADSTLVNKVCGLRLFRAKVYKAESWLDGRAAIIIDYNETSWLVGYVRDEIRQVRPGVYLGIAYFRTKPKPTFATYFALDFRHQVAVGAAVPYAAAA